MRIIQICVGSSCHLKGSYHVIQTFRQLIETQGLEQQVELKASFCMQKCTKGISATIDGELIEDLTVNNCEAIFTERIL